MDYIGATPQSNPIMGLLAERLKQAQQFATRPFGYQNPPAEMLLNLLGVPAVQQTAERLAYGEPLTTGRGMTTQIRPEVAEAALTVAPVAGLLGRGAEKAAMAAGRAGERYAERVVPQIMEKGGLPAQLLQDLGQGSIRPMDVWHGSPHGPFTKFDPTKIGSGEGAQAYSYGHYLGEARGTGETYRNQLVRAGKEQINKLLQSDDMASQIAGNTLNEYKNPSSAIEALKSSLTPSTTDIARAETNKAIKMLEDVNKEVGYLYKVDLPDEAIAKMLDWDKPLSKQPEIVKSMTPESMGLKLREPVGSGFMAYIAPNGKPIGLQIKGTTPEKFRESWIKRLQEIGDLEGGAGRAVGYLGGTSSDLAPSVSEAMRKAGILGIKYFDEGSRGAKQGTRNFVVFPGGEDLLTIKEINDKPIGGLLGQSKATFDVTKKDASELFGAGAQRVMYQDPKSGGAMEVLVKPDGTASVLSLEVPETSRGKGIGQSLQAQVMQDYPEMMGQVSSKAAAKTAYRLGRRPPFKPDATLEDVYKMMDEDSSVNMVSPEMQKRFRQSLLD